MGNDISLTHGPFTPVKISHKSDRLKNTDTAVQEENERLKQTLFFTERDSTKYAMRDGQHELRLSEALSVLDEVVGA